MLTQCPDCGKNYTITKKQQRAKKAQIYCIECKKKFNASIVLNEKPVKISETNEPRTFYVPESIDVIKPESKPEIVSTLLTEAKTEFIPKEELRQVSSDTNKSELPPYLANIGGVLKKSTGKAATIVPKVAVPDPEHLPWETKTQQYQVNWAVGVVVCLVLLISQVIYLEVPRLSQHTTYRPLLEKLCSLIGCQVAAYENISEFTVMQGSFTTQSDNTILFKTGINNQAPFKQRLPNIQLNLLDYDGQLIAQRIFYPTDYLFGSSTKKSTIGPDETVEAKLLLAVPDVPIGGYNYNLVY